MPAYSFRPQFVEPIRAGTKGGTIRAGRRGRQNPFLEPREGGQARVGEEMALYCQQRSRHGFLIKRVECVAVEPIWLDFGRMSVELRNSRTVLRSNGALLAFALFDGFNGFDEMTAFWQQTHQTDYFTGYHVRWLPLPGEIYQADPPHETRRAVP